MPSLALTIIQSLVAGVSAAVLVHWFTAHRETNRLLLEKLESLRTSEREVFGRIVAIAAQQGGKVEDAMEIHRSTDQMLAIAAIYHPELEPQCEGLVADYLILCEKAVSGTPSLEPPKESAKAFEQAVRERARQLLDRSLWGRLGIKSLLRR